MKQPRKFCWQIVCAITFVPDASIFICRTILFLLKPSFKRKQINSDQQHNRWRNVWVGLKIFESFVGLSRLQAKCFLAIRRYQVYSLLVTSNIIVTQVKYARIFLSQDNVSWQFYFIKKSDNFLHCHKDRNKQDNIKAISQSRKNVRCMNCIYQLV